MKSNSIVIIGAGIAGLSAALRLSPYPVTVVVGAPLGEGNASAWAQGGIAAAMGDDDDAKLHADDTVSAGAGLVDPVRALSLAQGARAQVEWLQKLGVPFDVDESGKLVLGREAAHGKHRIAHAGGDSTGAAVMQALIEHAKKTPSIKILSGWRAEDLRIENGRVTGLKLASNGARAMLACDTVVLATGGVGQLFSCTTNPGAARGDGLAMAARAGAVLADLEFVQFHPTALDIGRDPMPLLTEALRGDGAILLNSEGQRFMLAEHKLAELAPRDVVARAIWRQLQEGLKPVLDARECFASKVNDKYPIIREVCLHAGIDPTHQALPVAPAAHYHMGGVLIDENGCTSVPGLFACGEVSCGFIHGANRLASNSLLDALVYAEKIAATLSKENIVPADAPQETGKVATLPRENEEIIRAELRKLMYDRLGLIRDEQGMVAALRRLAQLNENVPPSSRLSSQLLVAAMIAQSAVQRRESRGGHYRIDYPDMENPPRHSRITFASFQEAMQTDTKTFWVESKAA